MSPDESGLQAAAKAITERANIRTMAPHRFTAAAKAAWAKDFASAAITAYLETTTRPSEERATPAQGSEPEGSGFAKPWVAQPGVTFLAASAFVRSVIELEPGPPAGLVAIDIEGKWNHGAKDTLSILVKPEVANEWGDFMQQAAEAAPKDVERYQQEHP